MRRVYRDSNFSFDRIQKDANYKPFHLEKAESVLLSMLFLQLSLRNVVLYFSLLNEIPPPATPPAFSVGR